MPRRSTAARTTSSSKEGGKPGAWTEITRSPSLGVALVPRHQVRERAQRVHAEDVEELDEDRAAALLVHPQRRDVDPAHRRGGTAVRGSCRRGRARPADGSATAGTPYDVAPCSWSPRSPTASWAARTCRSPRGCSAGGRRWCSSLSFVALAVLWPRPRLERAPERRVAQLPAWLEVPLGLLGVGAVRASSIYAGIAGEQVDTTNLAPTFVYVAFWVGLLPLQVLLGDVFAAVNPWRAVGRAAGWVAGRVAGDVGAGADGLPGVARTLAGRDRDPRVRLARARVDEPGRPVDARRARPGLRGDPARRA